MVDKPRTSVSKGGLWQGHTADYSQQTQNLLKVMMEESKLTSYQQRKLRQAMKDGSALPMRCHPSSSYQERQISVHSPPATSKSARINMRTYSGGVRSKEDIDKSPAAMPSDYRPRPKKTMGDLQKRRLQNMMAFGKEVPEVPDDKRLQALRAKTPPPRKDRFEELQDEINERRQFLSEMESLGRAKDYRTIIETEVSGLIREMEIIDRKRTMALEQAEEEQQAKTPLSSPPKP